MLELQHKEIMFENKTVLYAQGRPLLENKLKTEETEGF